MEIMKSSGNTKAFGWDVHLEFFKRRGNVYFEVQAVWEYFDIKKHISKHGYKFIDKFLSENGEFNIMNCLKNCMSRFSKCNLLGSLNITSTTYR
jgi:hypothetical protein